MKRLYISDLDGTLLTSQQTVAEKSAQMLNRCIGEGAYFTFATARSVYSAKPMTESININVPCILMNGVSIYDLENDKYIKNEFIPAQACEEIINVFEGFDVRCFMYKICEEVLTAHFTEMTSDVMRQFAQERKRKFRKPFVQCNRFEKADDIVYFTTTGEHGLLLPLKQEIDLIIGADCAFYEDTYTGEWYLEVFSSRASKYNGVKFLSEKYGFEQVTCFGDNLNDIPMFNASDYRVAVENAKPEVKELADDVTASNNEDGVALWLEKNFKNNK